MYAKQNLKGTSLEVLIAKIYVRILRLLCSRRASYRKRGNARCSLLQIVAAIWLLSVLVKLWVAVHSWILRPGDLLPVIHFHLTVLVTHLLSAHGHLSPLDVVILIHCFHNDQVAPVDGPDPANKCECRQELHQAD